MASFGGQNALARALGISQGTVSGWVKRGRIPYERVNSVVAAAQRLDPPVILTAEDFIVIGSASEAEADAA